MLFMGVDIKNQPQRISDQVKKTWLYTSTPPYAFRALYLISYAQGQLYRYLNTSFDNVYEWNLGEKREDCSTKAYAAIDGIPAKMHPSIF
jgi:hypothetical protein